MHYLDVRKKRSHNEFQEDIDRELELNQRNLGIVRDVVSCLNENAFFYTIILIQFPKYILKRKKDEREKPLLFNLVKVVRFLISPKKKKEEIEENKIMNPAFLLGTAFKIAYWHRKYHSGTICKGVSNPQTSNALSGCEKEEIP